MDLGRAYGSYGSISYLNILREFVILCLLYNAKYVKSYRNGLPVESVYKYCYYLFIT